MYRWVRPRIAVPMHGESRHLIEHAEFARKAGAAEVMIVTNGDCLRIAPGKRQDRRPRAKSAGSGSTARG